VRVLRERGAEFGLDEQKNLARVLADPEPRRAIAGMTDAAEAHVRERLRQRAEKAIALEREDLAQRRSLGRGMGMGR
jgi:hypothetical protein